MFVYYYVHLETPFEDAAARLDHVLGSFGEFAGDAYREGESIRAKAGPRGASSAVAKTVEIEVHRRVRINSSIAVPMTWTATGTPSLFPKLEGDLILAGVGPHITQVALRGTYTPPLGGVGRALDRMLLHHVAEATVKSFVDRVARGLGEAHAIATEA